MKSGFFRHMDLKFFTVRCKNRVKKVFDLGMAVAIGLVTLPIMAVAAVIVRLESPGPIIYSQDRVGENGKEFKVHKFRSMRNDAEKDGAKWAQQNDPRVTKFGNIMRKTRIDEKYYFSKINMEQVPITEEERKIFYLSMKKFL